MDSRTEFSTRRASASFATTEYNAPARRGGRTEHTMTPATISEWIDQTRQLLEDDLIDCKAAAIDTVAYQLDCLEQQILKEPVLARTAAPTITVNVHGVAYDAAKIAQALLSPPATRRSFRRRRT
jgi:hypothetical protein